MLEVLKSHKLLLASQSPRRSEILVSANIPFELIPSDWEEIFDSNMNIKKVPQYLSYQKAIHASKNLQLNQIILTADTIVINKNKVLGKPQNNEEAVSMLNKLSGKNHKVISGITLMSKTKTVNASCRTEVKIEPLTNQEIESYIQKYKPLDKAGSYGIQDWMGICKVSMIKGSYTNVMGLPSHIVYNILSQW